MERLNILIDTNVFIAVDPLHPEQTADAARAAPLQRLVQQGGHRLFVHPYALADLRRDSNAQRHEARLALFGKYAVLQDSPRVTGKLIARIGGTAPRPGGNNDPVATTTSTTITWLPSTKVRSPGW